MNLKVSLLSFNFVMVYIIHKILALLENHVNFLKDNIYNAFLRSIIVLLYNVFRKTVFFSQHIITESLSLEEKNN